MLRTGGFDIWYCERGATRNGNHLTAQIKHVNCHRSQLSIDDIHLAKNAIWSGLWIEEAICNIQPASSTFAPARASLLSTLLVFFLEISIQDEHRQFSPESSIGATMSHQVLLDLRFCGVQLL